MARKNDKSAQALNDKSKREMIARLARNEDFKCFLRWYLDDFCVFDGVTAPLDPFVQGIRAGTTRVMDCLCTTKEGATLVAGIAHEFFMARGKVAEAKRVKKAKEDVNYA